MPTLKRWDGTAWETLSGGTSTPSTVTGGTMTEPGDGYRYHTFERGRDGEALVVEGATRTGADILVVAGGGGGGAGTNGVLYSTGGGGGEVIELLSQSLVVGSYTVAVGAAGIASAGDGTSGGAGGTSSIAASSAAGGLGGTGTASGASGNGNAAGANNGTASGGAGGAGGAGTAAPSGTAPGDGGQGITVFDGLEYGGGGAGNSSGGVGVDGTTRAHGYGTGGRQGAAGYHGRVIVRYPEPATRLPAYANAVLVDKPTSYWRLSDSGTSLVDEVAGYVATMSGTYTQGQAAIVPSTDDGSLYVGGGSASLPVEAMPSGVSAISIEFWTKGHNGATNSAFWLNTSNNSRAAQAHLPHDGTVYWDAGATGGTGDAGDRISKAATGIVWADLHHWVFTKDANAGTMSIYLDGALWHSGTGLTKPIPAVANGRLFAAYDGSSAMVATVDEWAIYPFALSATQVSNHYSKGTTV